MSFARRMKRKNLVSVGPVSYPPTGSRHNNLSSRDQVIIHDALNRSVDHYLTCMYMALHDEFGFGPARLKRVYERLSNISECVGNGYVKLEELQNFIKCEFNESEYERKYGAGKISRSRRNFQEQARFPGAGGISRSRRNFPENGQKS